MERKNCNQDLSGWQGDIPVTNLYTVGIAGGEFFSALKERGKVLGTRCNKCDFTYVPARYFCERCFATLNEYVEILDEGIIETYTVCYVDVDNKPLKEPEIIAAIKLNGASTILIHIIKAEPSKISVGKKVKAIFHPKVKRRGVITDIKYFVLS
ncbi:MAG: hypothetical protein A2W23_04340 [Planctomycetes bacterium RBG_16_43_13]|nr:MAG: hypothetical protein A2W23_04340 [Planctomycetes bacterium RBG_16_43_13]